MTQDKTIDQEAEIEIVNNLLRDLTLIEKKLIGARDISNLTILNDIVGKQKEINTQLDKLEYLDIDFEPHRKRLNSSIKSLHDEIQNNPKFKSIQQTPCTMPFYCAVQAQRTPNVERGPGAEIECRQQPVSTCSSIARPFNLSLSAKPVHARRGLLPRLVRWRENRRRVRLAACQQPRMTGCRARRGRRRSKKPDVPSWTERVPPSSPRTPPPTMVKAITTRIIAAPLHCKEKDARLPSPAEFATGTVEDKLELMDGLIQDLASS
ncbi:unnamed protein product [Trichogramma brassicae]|uniref:Uncharacterized protein n=1 Tax=Trichogramma brassicae TaxID=86971 RepID=A0A6H5J161_9HYME|nr:unnamed protein product [Trichogramma brassicae]